jgi:hypothetical protein
MLGTENATRIFFPKSMVKGDPELFFLLYVTGKFGPTANDCAIGECTAKE